MRIPLKIFEEIGQYTILMSRCFRKPDNPRMFLKELMRQMYDVGIGSLGIVVMISIFIGAVTAVQTAFQLLDSFIPETYVGFIVRDTTLLELAPTFTCLVLAGKLGSNMASELGSMRISEQIDALEMMGVNSANYLVTPKILAGFLMIPILVILSAACGMYGGYLAVKLSLVIQPNNYLEGLQAFFEASYVRITVIKAFVFSFLLTSVSCFKGYYVKGGALEIGENSTKAVVYASVLILLGDYALAVLLT